MKRPRCSAVLRARGRDFNRLRREKLAPLGPLREYRREAVPREGCIHDVVAGVRQVVVGARLEKYSVIRQEKCGKRLRIQFQENETRIKDKF